MKYTPTREMSRIFRFADERRSFVVEAKAGAGKTSTVAQVIRRVVSATNPVLYLVFNVHNIADAKEKLRGIEHVTITNVHKLAFANLGIKYKDKIGDMNFPAYAELIGSKDSNLVSSVRKTINNFITSSDATINSRHAPSIGRSYNSTCKTSRVVDHARRIWSRMLDVDDKLAKMPHDGYLHQFCTTNIGLRVLSQFPTVIVDESQDQNETSIALEKAYLFENSQHQLIKVGDEHQALYRFRNAVNANARYRDTLPFLPLSKSWRFGEEVAALSQQILTLKGTPRTDKIYGNEQTHTAILPPGSRLSGPRVVLHRTAAGVVRTAIALLAKGVRFNVMGGINNYITQDLRWYEQLRQGKTVGIPVYFIRNVPNWQKVEELAKNHEDPDITRVVKIFELCQANRINSIQELISRIEGQESDCDSKAITLSTVHRYKGSEADQVILSNDFRTLDKLALLNNEELVDEINTLYVAVTRARKRLVLDETTQQIMNGKGIMRQKKARNSNRYCAR